jgi:hypothetical protein
MEVSNGLKFTDVKKRIGEHLKTALDIEEFTITFAKHEETKWRVNVEYKENIGGTLFPTTALFTLDNETGDIMEFQKGRQWSF